jgi:hypothetical protein
MVVVVVMVSGYCNKNYKKKITRNHNKEKGEN